MALTFRRCGPWTEFVWLSQSLSDRWITGHRFFPGKNKLNNICWIEIFVISLCKQKQKDMSNIKDQEVNSHWTKVAKRVLEGKTIVEVRYLNDEEMEMMGWYKRPVCFVLNDGTSCMLSCDDEGNDGGVLFYGTDGVLPVL